MRGKVFLMLRNVLFFPTVILVVGSNHILKMVEKMC